MKIDCKNIFATQHIALTHIMLQDSKIAKEIGKTLTHDNKIIDVDLRFNGVVVDAKIIEDWLQEQYKNQEVQLQKQYEDVEKEIQKRVEEQLNALTNAHISALKERTQKIQDVLFQINEDLEYVNWYDGC